MTTDFEEASKEDLAKWRSEFSVRKEFWIPDWHFHEQSHHWVFGIKQEDGCYLCDIGYKALTKAQIAGEPIPSITCISIPEERVNRWQYKILTWGGIENVPWRTYDEEKPSKPTLAVPTEYPAKREDFTRWKKQFAPMMVQLVNRYSEVKRDFKEDVEDDLPPPEGIIQINILGQSELVPFRKKRGASKK